MRYTPDEIAAAILAAEDAARQAYTSTAPELRERVPIFRPPYRTLEQIISAQVHRSTPDRRRPGALRSTPGEWWR